MIDSDAVLHRLWNLHVRCELHDTWRLRQSTRSGLEWIRIRGIADHITNEPARLEVQQIRDRGGATAVVEDAEPAAYDVGLLVAGRAHSLCDQQSLVSG